MNYLKVMFDIFADLHKNAKPLSIQVEHQLLWAKVQPICGSKWLDTLPADGWQYTICNILYTPALTIIKLYIVKISCCF